MKARLILSVLCMTMFISLSAQTSTSTLKEAKELKDGGNYLEAAKKYSESRTANLVGNCWMFLHQKQNAIICLMIISN